MKYTPRELKDNVNISWTSPLKELFLLLGGVLGIVLLVYIALGFAVDVVVKKLPAEIEKDLGGLYSGMYENTEKTPAGLRLQQILDELVKQLPERELQYKARLVHGSRANALALPGGNVIIFSALIKEIDSENTLAFVLAHELGHFANRDHLRGLGRRLVLLFFSVALLGTDSSVTNFIMSSVINVEMKFSQRQEKMADLFALDLLNRRYGHVSGATDFFERMSKKEKMSHILYYFTTHPYPESRVGILNEKIKEKGYAMKEKIPLNDSFKSPED